MAAVQKVSIASRRNGSFQDRQFSTLMATWRVKSQRSRKGGFNSLCIAICRRSRSPPPITTIAVRRLLLFHRKSNSDVGISSMCRKPLGKRAKRFKPSLFGAHRPCATLDISGDDERFASLDRPSGWERTVALEAKGPIPTACCRLRGRVLIEFGSCAAWPYWS